MPSLAHGPSAAAVPAWFLDVGIAAAATFMCVIGTIHLAADSAADRGGDALAVTLAVVAAAPLVFRRRWPWPVFIVSMAAVATYTGRAYPGGPIYLAGAVALFGVARVSDRRVGYGIAAAVAATMFGVSVVARRAVDLNDIAFAGWPAVAVLAADAVRGRSERLGVEAERAAHANEQHELELSRRLVEDRVRIARDLHDTVAHSMATINVQSGVAAHVLDRNPAQAGVALEAIRVASRDVQQELTAMLDVLRADGVGGAPRQPTPGLTGLDALVDSAGLAGVRVTLDVTGDVEALPPAVSTAAYRIVQEALTNVSRHAATDRATVTVRADPATVTVEVVDRGRGTAAAPDGRAGRGLAGICERAAITGGVAEIGGGDGGGFRVRVAWDRSQ